MNKATDTKQSLHENALLSREAISQLGMRDAPTQAEKPVSTVAPTINLQNESNATMVEIVVVLASLAAALWYLWRKFIAPKTRGCGSCGGKGKSCVNAGKAKKDDLFPELEALEHLKIGGGHHSTAPVAQQREDF